MIKTKGKEEKNPSEKLTVIVFAVILFMSVG